jgi:hypothetical protein
MMRIRRVKLSEQQLLSRNVSEAIIDKDNHATDACKYVVMSHPESTEKTPKELAVEAVRALVEAGDLTSAIIRYQQMTAVPENRPIRIGRYVPPRWRRRY